MLRNAIAASAAIALTLAPIAAQAAPQELSRTGAAVGESEELVGTTMWIVAAVALGLIIWGIIELTDDNEPESP
jgi:hypothetical protein